MIKMMLVAAFLVAIAAMACGPSATTSESDPSASPQPTEKSGPALLLSEESAISILQVYLQECILSSRGPNTLSTYNRTNPLSEQERKRLKDLLMDLATEENGNFEWSASYHGVTEVPRTNTEAETWVVIGPGFEKAGSQFVVPGRWQVYAGERRAYYLDAHARLVSQEYHRFSTCSG